MGKFQPGNPGGPGRPKMPEDVLEAKRLSKAELERVFNKYIHLSKAELRSLIDKNNEEGDKLTVIEAVVASILAHAMAKGDQIRLNFILERLVGKVPNQINLGSQDGSPGRS